jgi:hypothetical protein
MTAPKAQIRSVERAIEKHKRKNKYFTSITPDEIERMLTHASPPYLVGLGWSDSTPGGILNCSAGIYNPATFQAFNLYVHVWVGSGIVDPAGDDTFLFNVDARFPRLLEPDFPGLTIQPNSGEGLNFALQIPSTIERTHYILCCCLLRLSGSRNRRILDRFTTVFKIA